MAQFLPSFQAAAMTDGKIEYTNEPEDLQSDEETATETEEAEKHSFVFIVDQSGSMSGMPIEIVKEALQLFIQSLPQGCEFQIISFGSHSEAMFTYMVEYNEKNK